MSALSIYALAFATRTPPKNFAQQDLFKMAGYADFPLEERRRVQALFRAVGVERRAMWLSESNYRPSHDPNDFHQRYISGIREIAPKVAAQALEKAGLKGSDLDFLVFSSCTGYTCPGYSVELAYALGMPEDRPTANLLGMGCSSLVPALERAVDRLVAHPGSRALVVSAEICSATYWIDHDPETAVGNALFGDGSAAMVLSSREEDATRIREIDGCVAKLEGFRTLRDGRYLFDMGFNQSNGRLKVRLDREIPERIAPMALKMLGALELAPGSRISIHPGGRKILDLMGASLLPQSQKWAEPLSWSRTVMRNHGNMSSPTVAFVLEQSIVERTLVPGEVGALMTMGPGLSVEGVRIRWV